MATSDQASETIRPDRELLLFALVVPAALSFSDSALLNIWVTSYYETTWLVVTYFWFCFQTAAVAWLVGRRLRKSQWWWGILVWTMVLIDLQVFATAAPARWSDPSKLFGFAFASAQAGLVVTAGLLGSASWRLRLPLATIGFAWALTFGMLLEARGMLLIMIGQCVATALFCTVMRLAGFRFLRFDNLSLGGELEGGQPSQFSIRHLFYWMTTAGILTGFVRSVGFGVVPLYVGWKELPLIVGTALVLTLVSVIACWTALGRERWQWRLVFGLSLLPTIGIASGYVIDQSLRTLTYVPAYWLFPYSWRGDGSIGLWCLWTTLAGGFLASILLVFRGSGQHIYWLSRQARSKRPPIL